MDNPSTNFIRSLLREGSLVRTFFPVYPVMENCPRKEEYDRQLKIVRDKEIEVDLLYKQPFEKLFEETYRDKIQRYVDYVVQQELKRATYPMREKEYIENDYSCWVISEHHIDRVTLSCLRAELQVPFEYLFREMSVEEYFNKT